MSTIVSRYAVRLGCNTLPPHDDSTIMSTIMSTIISTIMISVRSGPHAAEMWELLFWSSPASPLHTRLFVGAVQCLKLKLWRVTMLSICSALNCNYISSHMSKYSLVPFFLNPLVWFKHLFQIKYKFFTAFIMKRYLNRCFAEYRFYIEAHCLPHQTHIVVSPSLALLCITPFL